jgi:HSP20 family molecular chaperone IbpA
MNPATKLGSRVVRKLSGAWKALTGGRRFVPTRGNGTHPQIHAAQQKALSGALDVLQCQRAAECWETARAIVVKVEIPRASFGDLAVSLHPGVLRVRAAKHSIGKRRGRFCLLIERAFNRLERSIPLPDNIDPTQADISYQDGVLTVIVPKTKVSPPAQLPIP